MNFREGTFRKLLLLITFAVLLFTAVQNLSMVFGFLGRVWQIFFPVILGLCIAFVLNVLMRFFENKVFAVMGRSRRGWVKKLRRPASLTATFAAVMGAIALVLVVIVPSLRETTDSLIASLPAYGERALGWLTDLMADFNLSEEFIREIAVDWNKIGDLLYGMLTSGTGSLFDYAGNIFGGMVSFFVGLFFAIYVLLEKEKIGCFLDRAMHAFLPDRVCGRIEKIAALSNTVFSNFITGQLLEALVLGTLCFIGMLIFGFPYAAVISVLVGITALIPIFGAWIGGGISAFLILMVSPVKALLFLVFLLVLQQLEGNLIYPRVVGKSVGLPGILVLIAVVVGSNLGGVGSILVSVPLCSVLYTLFRELVDERLAARRQSAGPANQPEPEAAPTQGGAPAPTPFPARKRQNKQKRG